MKTIGFPLYADIPTIDEAPAMQKICQQFRGSKVVIKVQDLEIDPQQANQISGLSRYGGRFVEVVADGPQEALLAAAVHQQLAKDRYSY